ncbi:hypothetical protein [Streptococcus pantholopis]|nr:hypothetical protein [Streptococcus pantholopis]
MASDAGITLTAIFFTKILGRVQFIKIDSNENFYCRLPFIVF